MLYVLVKTRKGTLVGSYRSESCLHVLGRSDASLVPMVGRKIGLDHASLEIREGGGVGEGLRGFQAAARAVEDGLSVSTNSGVPSAEFPTYDQLVADHIRLALLRTRGVKSRAANLLSIDRNRLYRLMHKYQIVPD